MLFIAMSSLLQMTGICQVKNRLFALFKSEQKAFLALMPNDKIFLKLYIHP